MPNEALITQIENILTEIVGIGGQQEITSVVTNLEVVDASPTGLTGFITIKDERDGNTILAKKVPGVGYSVADLVNVLFINGTEPIAFQQASQSSGDAVLVSKLVSPDETINPVISADNSGDVTIAGAGNLIIPNQIIRSGDTDTLIDMGSDDSMLFTIGGLDMINLTEDGVQDEIVLGNGSDIDIDLNQAMFVEGSSGDVGINTVVPGTIASGSSTGIILNIRDGTNSAELALQGTAGGAKLNMVDLGGAANDKWMQYFTDGGVTKYRSLTDVGGLQTNNIFIMRHSDGNSAIGNFPTTAKFYIDQLSTTAAEPVLLLDQADVDEPFTKYRGTAAAANLTRSIVDEGDVTTATRIGWVKIEIDDVGNQVTDGDYFIPFYSLA